MFTFIVRCMPSFLAVQYMVIGDVSKDTQYVLLQGFRK